MTSATQLVNIIVNNDYENLEKLILCKKKIDWGGKDRKGTNAIRKAVEVRAKECFDLLLDNNVVSIDDPYQSGLAMALEYFSNAPNHSNRYYLNKYIQKKASVNLSLFEDLFLKINIREHSDIIHALLDNLNLIEHQYGSLIKCPIIKNNFEAFKFAHEYVEDKNHQPLNQQFYQECYKLAIESNSIDIIEFLQTKNINLLVCDGKPSLSIALYNNSELVINKLLNLYESLSEEHLNQIPNIKNFSFIKTNDSNNREKLGTKFKIYFGNIDRILKLKVEYNIGEFIELLIELANSSSSAYYYGYSRLTLENYDNIMGLIYYLLNEKYLKSNPFEIITQPKYLKIFDEMKTINYKHNYGRYQSELTSLGKVISLFEFFGFEPSETIKVHYHTIIFPGDKNLWVKNIKEKFETFKKPPVVKKAEPKKKATKKKNSDLEV